MVSTGTAGYNADPPSYGQQPANQSHVAAFATPASQYPPYANAAAGYNAGPPPYGQEPAYQSKIASSAPPASQYPAYANVAYTTQQQPAATTVYHAQTPQVVTTQIRTVTIDPNLCRNCQQAGMVRKMNMCVLVWMIILIVLTIIAFPLNFLFLLMMLCLYEKRCPNCGHTTKAW